LKEKIPGERESVHQYALVQNEKAMNSMNFASVHPRKSTSILKTFARMSGAGYAQIPANSDPDLAIKFKNR
jgi:hypothetical protein